MAGAKWRRGVMRSAAVGLYRFRETASRRRPQDFQVRTVSACRHRETPDGELAHSHCCLANW